MRRPRPLPEPLLRAAAFSVAEANRRGVGISRLAASDLVSPYRGVRVHEGRTFDRPAAFAERMTPAQFFSHSTAALLYGIPLPRALENFAVLHVSVHRPDARPRVRGVHGHVLDPETNPVVTEAGYRLGRASAVWCQLAEQLGRDDLVIAGDYLVTGRAPLGGPPPLTGIDELTQAVAARAGHRGARMLRDAVTLVRYGSVSPGETRVRLLLERAGLPLPELNLRVVRPDGSFVAIVDIGWPRYGVAVEYEGDLHRERQRFRADIRRRERLEDAGWTIIRLTADDLAPFRADETVARVRARLRSRGWAGAA